MPPCRVTLNSFPAARTPCTVTIAPFSLAARTMSSSALTWSDIHETPNLNRTKVVPTSGSTVVIHAPAGRVFEILTAFDKYNEWNSGCPTVSFQEGDKIGVGAVGTMHVKKEGQEKAFKMPAKVTALCSEGAPCTLFP